MGRLDLASYAGLVPTVHTVVTSMIKTEQDAACYLKVVYGMARQKGPAVVQVDQTGSILEVRSLENWLDHRASEDLEIVQEAFDFVHSTMDDGKWDPGKKTELAIVPLAWAYVARQMPTTMDGRDAEAFAEWAPKFVRAVEIRARDEIKVARRTRIKLED